MKHRSFMLALSVIVVLGLAAPALANPAGAAVVVVQGSATVGKIISGDNPNDGCDSVSGSGLGIPIISQAKNAYYRFATTVTVINSLGIHEGRLLICGKLLPSLDNLIKVPGNTKKGIGAGCGLSKGHDGRGVIEIVGPVTSPKLGLKLWLTDVGWKADFPGGHAFAETALITGKIHTGNDAVKGKGKTPLDGFIGLYSMSGGADCFNKRDNPKLQVLSTEPKPTNSNQGARTYNIFSVWTVVPGGAFLGNRNDRPGSPKGSNDMPIFCKKQKKDSDPCAYKTKK